MRLAVLIVLSAAALISGCSSGSAGNGGQVTGTTSVANAPTSSVSSSATSSTPAAGSPAENRARAAGCTNITAAKNIYAETVVQCSIGGGTAEVTSWVNNTARDDYYKMASGFTTVSAARQGDKWLVMSNNAPSSALAPFGGTVLR